MIKDFHKTRLGILNEGKGIVPPHELEKRHTGRSTSLAFRFLSDAITEPDKPIRIFDHTCWKNQRHEAKFIFSVIEEMVKKLGLEGFYYNKRFAQIKFKLKNEPTMDWIEFK